MSGSDEMLPALGQTAITAGEGQIPGSVSPPRNHVGREPTWRPIAEIGSSSESKSRTAHRYTGPSDVDHPSGYTTHMTRSCE